MATSLQSYIAGSSELSYTAQRALAEDRAAANLKNEEALRVAQRATRLAETASSDADFESLKAQDALTMASRAAMWHESVGVYTKAEAAADAAAIAAASANLAAKKSLAAVAKADLVTAQREQQTALEILQQPYVPKYSPSDNKELDQALREKHVRDSQQTLKEAEETLAYISTIPGEDATKFKEKVSAAKLALEQSQKMLNEADNPATASDIKNSGASVYEAPASTSQQIPNMSDKITEATVKMVDDGVVKEKVLADPGGTIGAADIADAAGEVAAAEPSNMSSAVNNLVQAKADALTGKAQAKLTGAVNAIQSKIDNKMKGVNSLVGAVNGKINAANKILGKLGGNTKASVSTDTTSVTAQDANAAGAGIKSSVPGHVYALFNKSDLNDKVIFTVMPQVSESRSVSYESVQPAQFPGAFHKYKGTESTTYTISAVFASSTPYQAGKNLENLRRLKSWTMPFFGDKVPKDKLGAPPPVLLFRGLRGAVGEVPVVITSLSYDWPKDVDYIKAQGSNGDTPFPAIMTVSISVVESFSVAEFNGFDLAAFANGDMANAFKAVVPAVAQSGTTDTALAQDTSGNGSGLGGLGSGLKGLGSSLGAATLSIGDIRSIGSGTGAFDNISGLTGAIAGDGASRIGTSFARGSFADGAGLVDTHLASPGMIAGALSDPRREEAFNGGRQFNPSINVFGQGAFTPTFESLSRVDPRDEARKASKQMMAKMFQEPLSSATELKFAGKK